MQHDPLDDREAAAKRDRVGRMPAGGGERALDIRLGADQCHVQRIARQAVGCARDLGHRPHCRQVLVVAPEGRQHEVGKRQVDPDRKDHRAPDASHGRFLRGLNVGGCSASGPAPVGDAGMDVATALATARHSRTSRRPSWSRRSPPTGSWNSRRRPTPIGTPPGATRRRAADRRTRQGWHRSRRR